MRVTIEHREGEATLLRKERAYYLDCSIDFSEEEKAVIARRALGEHYITMPDGYPATPDTADETRLYSLKLAVASGMALFSIILAIVTGGHPMASFLFVGTAGYAVYCLYRFLKPKALLYEQITLQSLIKHRRFIVQTPNPSRSKEVEDQILGSISNMKGFLEASTDVAPRSVREF